MYDSSYIDYLNYFHCDRDYFECHEVLEEHWKKDPPGQRKAYWVGLIQIAVAMYHQRRGNYSGARKMITNAIGLLENNKQALIELGLNSETLIKILKKREKEIINCEEYYSIDLPIIDKALLKHCQNLCEKRNTHWGQNSDMSNQFLVHKHSLRDRSEIINERNSQLVLRNKKGDL